jgi:hypothetical protein
MTESFHSPLLAISREIATNFETRHELIPTPTG